MSIIDDAPVCPLCGADLEITDYEVDDLGVPIETCSCVECDYAVRQPVTDEDGWLPLDD